MTNKIKLIVKFNCPRCGKKRKDKKPEVVIEQGEVYYQDRVCFYVKCSNCKCCFRTDLGQT